VVCFLSMMRDPAPQIKELSQSYAVRGPVLESIGNPLENQHVRHSV